MYPKEWQYLKDYEWEGKEEDMRCLRDRVYEVEIQQVFKVISLNYDHMLYSTPKETYRLLLLNILIGDSYVIGGYIAQEFCMELSNS